MNLKKKLLRKENGITLIALVITIIVLLILAGVAISMLAGENWILTKAQEAAQEQERANIQDLTIAGYYYELIAATQDFKYLNMEKTAQGIYANLTNNGYKLTKNDGSDITDANALLSSEEGESVITLNVEGKHGDYKGEVTNTGLTKDIEIVGSISEVIPPQEPEQPEDPVISLVTEVQGKILSSTDNTQVADEYGNFVFVPAGFAITKDASKVEDGIVITDSVDEYGNSIGNEFVWIPVGTVKTSTEDKDITLGRYKWNDTTPAEIQTVATQDDALTAAETAIEAESKCYEVTPNNTSYGSCSNAKAKNLEQFLKSVVKNGGYYLARYEAGIEGTKDNASLSKKTNTSGSVKPLSKEGLGVWNSISQNKASELSQIMYTNSKFVSDLSNSYAWDTAIIYIQKMTEQNDYARQNSLNTKNPVTTGSTGDVKCNIYDMASNMTEWSTETCTSSSYNEVTRGGAFDISSMTVCDRMPAYNNWVDKDVGFRPILYLV